MICALSLGMPVKPVLAAPCPDGLSQSACNEAASPTGAEQVMEDIAASKNLDKIAHEAGRTPGPA